MNKGLKWTLIISGVVGVGVGLYFLLRKRKNKSNNTISNNTNTNSSSMSATAQNGNIVITSGSNTYRYKLQGFKFYKWWTIDVNKIDLPNKSVTWTNPMDSSQSTDTLESWVVNDITKGVGNSIIDMGKTEDGTKIRLTKV